MATEKYTTSSQSTLATAYTSGNVSVVVDNAASFPTAGNFRLRIDNELFKCTAASGTTFTIVGAQEGTSAANHVAGSAVIQVMTAAMLDGIRTDISSIGTYSSLPSTTGQTAGNQYQPTDKVGRRLVYDGSAWQ